MLTRWKNFSKMSDVIDNRNRILDLDEELKDKELQRKFLHNRAEDEKYIRDFKNGTLKVGKSTRIPKLDTHWKFTPNSMDMFLGADNVGKSTWVWFVMTLGSYFHQMKWLILSYENLIPRIKIMVIQFLLHKNVKDNLISDSEFKKAVEFVNDHFEFMRIDKPITAYNCLDLATKISKLDGLVIDPYSSLLIDRDKWIGSKHDYDNEVLNQMKIFTRDVCSIYITLHPFSEGARRAYPKDHEYAGHQMPLQKADAEGGQKFANRADQFTIIHRMISHQERFHITELHVRKVKDYEITGIPTMLDSPVCMTYEKGGAGFADERGQNPMHPSEQIFDQQPPF